MRKRIGMASVCPKVGWLLKWEKYDKTEAQISYRWRPHSKSYAVFIFLYCPYLYAYRENNKVGLGSKKFARAWSNWICLSTTHKVGRNGGIVAVRQLLF